MGLCHRRPGVYPERQSPLGGDLVRVPRAQTPAPNRQPPPIDSRRDIRDLLHYPKHRPQYGNFISQESEVRHVRRMRQINHNH